MRSASNKTVKLEIEKLINKGMALPTIALQLGKVYGEDPAVIAEIYATGNKIPYHKALTMLEYVNQYHDMAKAELENAYYEIIEDHSVELTSSKERELTDKLYDDQASVDAWFYHLEDQASSGIVNLEYFVRDCQFYATKDQISLF
jgi:hypothetical protein